MRRLTLLLVVGFLAAACSDSADTTTTTAAAEATTATTQPPATTQAPTTTEAPTAAAPTLTWTGSECIYSGPDAFPSGEVINFTWRNESSVEMVVVVSELALYDDVVTLEDHVAIFPPTELYPVPGAEAVPESFLSARLVDPDSEVINTVIFHNAGDYGTACWPIDGSPAVPGELLTIEEPLTAAEALALNDAYFAAFNAGEADAAGSEHWLSE